jgi:hypothetical protein
MDFSSIRFVHGTYSGNRYGWVRCLMRRSISGGLVSEAPCLGKFSESESLGGNLFLVWWG